MADILLTGKAISDVKNIYDYIIEDSLQNAEMVKADFTEYQSFRPVSANGYFPFSKAAYENRLQIYC